MYTFPRPIGKEYSQHGMKINPCAGLSPVRASNGGHPALPVPAQSVHFRQQSERSRRYSRPYPGIRLDAQEGENLDLNQEISKRTSLFRSVFYRISHRELKNGKKLQ
jgi:hypothetical protein